MRSLVLAVPGDPMTRTGGYGYDRRIAEGLRDAGWDVRVAELDASFPTPTPAALEHAARALAAIPDGSAVMIDGLALGAMPDEVERETARLRLLALVHHPLARETGISPALASRLQASERRALAAVRRIVVTSAGTAEALGAYGVPPERIAVVEPGTDRMPIARGSGGAAVHLLSVASIVPRKGHELLVRALSRIDGVEWRLRCVGSVDRSAETVSRLQSLIRAHSLESRVTLAGELEGDALNAAYDGADAFVLATFYEGYGMSVAEALAHGLPVVATATGAIETIVGEAGIVVPPGDEDAFAAALSSIMERGRRAELAVKARARRECLTAWDHASRQMAEVVSVEFQR